MRGRQGGCLYDSAVFWQREDDDEGPRGWVVVVGVIVGEYFAHLISSASFHYVITLSAAASGGQVDICVALKPQLQPLVFKADKVCVFILLNSASAHSQEV